MKTIWNKYNMKMPARLVVRCSKIGSLGLFGLFLLISCNTATKPAAADAMPGAISMKHPAIIELVADSGKEIDIKKLSVLAKDQALKEGAIYRWQNHYIIFDDISNPEKLSQQILHDFPGVQIKTYDSCFYNFNRSKCDTGSLAKEWDHIILTANLVTDTTLQREYMAYHATQFEKWPDIAKGFCHAGFQQLLLFRNERQLMLVISIPKGESLDAINPKTTENNPKMIEWNDMMKKYQEGIPGTKKGEVWVFFEAVSNQQSAVSRRL